MTPEDYGLILSASGWRGVFASTDEDSSPDLHASMIFPALAMGWAAAEYFQSMGAANPAPVLIGTDARPTGRELARIISACFAAQEVAKVYIGVAAAPEIMAAARESAQYRGFCYLSASHNPVGHNGLKMGKNDGGVLSAAEISPLIERIRELLADPKERAALDSATRSQLESAYQLSVDRQAKDRALAAYQAFTDETLYEGESEYRGLLRRSLDAAPLGVVGELNGSARGASIDKQFFDSVGIAARFFNSQPGEIAHAILPEGESLTPCRKLLEEAYRENPAFQLGYLPDNDGDRGNLVYIDSADGSGHILAAQEVFAISVLAELSFARFCISPRPKKQAVAVNGPTSLRIDALCRLLGVEVHRAEVGEANVVNLARKLRSAGYRVRILGEGSNGGTITHPAAVRDPLNTVGAFAKLLRYRSAKGLNPAEEWLRLSTGEQIEGPIDLPRILKSLPPYRTTPTGESRAKYPVKTRDHNLLKQRYESLFPSFWEERPAMLTHMGLNSYRFVNYEGTATIPGPGGRSAAGRGGFKVELLDSEGLAQAFLWMRGSGTEPVFRVMADIPGTSVRAEEELLDWHRRILDAADKEVI